MALCASTIDRGEKVRTCGGYGEDIPRLEGQIQSYWLFKSNFEFEPCQNLARLVRNMSQLQRQDNVIVGASGAE